MPLLYDSILSICISSAVGRYNQVSHTFIMPRGELYQQFAGLVGNPNLNDWRALFKK